MKTRRALLTTNRCFRLMFLLSGIIQSWRRQISLYHLIILESLLAITRIPENRYDHLRFKWTDIIFLCIFSSVSIFQTLFVAIVILHGNQQGCLKSIYTARTLQLSLTPFLIISDIVNVTEAYRRMSVEDGSMPPGSRTGSTFRGLGGVFAGGIISMWL